ncbi:hypothetical protein LINPERHAP2_LOCUS33603 [Linum perenne]
MASTDQIPESTRARTAQTAAVTSIVCEIQRKPNMRKKKAKKQKRVLEDVEIKGRSGESI